MEQKFIRLFFKFCKDNSLIPSSNEIKRIIRKLDAWVHTSKTEPRTFGKDYDTGNQDYRDFSELQNKMVQEIIDYINSHPNIQKIIEEKRKEITEEWNKDYPDEKNHIYPNVNIEFCIDGIDPSLIKGKWDPRTDSYIGIHIGVVSILEVM